MVETPPRETIEAARREAASAFRVVVKAGTNSLTDETSNIDEEKISKLVDDIVDLRERGKEVLLVSSGAIGAGKGRIGRPNETIARSQALSTIGQGDLMRHYTESFERYDQTVAQLLLTENDLESPERFENLRNTVETLLEWGVVPIINENDAVAIEEIQIGDNDMLSASVALGVDADLLVTLTDVNGVHTGNPKSDDEAERIEAVGDNFESIQRIVGDSTVAEFGGMTTKIEGARSVAESGVPAIIAESTEPNVLEKIAEADPVGTIFIPRGDPTDD
ncbi:MAG: glutamate 5-kinase [Halodesulfurarchaeum sp.]